MCYYDSIDSFTTWENTLRGSNVQRPGLIFNMMALDLLFSIFASACVFGFIFEMISLNDELALSGNLSEHHKTTCSNHVNTHTHNKLYTTFQLKLSTFRSFLFSTSPIISHTAPVPGQLHVDCQ